MRFIAFMLVMLCAGAAHAEWKKIAKAESNLLLVLPFRRPIIRQAHRTLSFDVSTGRTRRTPLVVERRHAPLIRPDLTGTGVRGSGGRQNKFALLGTLLKSISLAGDYALLPEKDTVRVAFEREASVRAFADTMGAGKTAREGGWAGQWSFAYDDAMIEKIRAVLPPPAKRSRHAPCEIARTDPS